MPATRQVVKLYGARPALVRISHSPPVDLTEHIVIDLAGHAHRWPVRRAEHPDGVQIVGDLAGRVDAARRQEVFAGRRVGPGGEGVPPVHVGPVPVLHVPRLQPDGGRGGVEDVGERGLAPLPLVGRQRVGPILADVPARFRLLGRGRPRRRRRPWQPRPPARTRPAAPAARSGRCGRTMVSAASAGVWSPRRRAKVVNRAANVAVRTALAGRC